MTSEARDILSKAFRILRAEEEFDLDRFGYRNDAAIASFMEALSLDPRMVEAWIGLGISYAYWPNRFEDAFQLSRQLNKSTLQTLMHIINLVDCTSTMRKPTMKQQEPKSMKRHCILFKKQLLGDTMISEISIIFWAQPISDSSDTMRL